jgi:hypothetical protein
MVLLPGSSLIDAGNDADCPATDQRGVGLPQEQLSTRYFFPWYNNLVMKSELRFAVP